MKVLSILDLSIMLGLLLERSFHICCRLSKTCTMISFPFFVVSVLAIWELEPPTRPTGEDSNSEFKVRLGVQRSVAAQKHCTAVGTGVSNTRALVPTFAWPNAEGFSVWDAFTLLLLAHCSPCTISASVISLVYLISNSYIHLSIIPGSNIWMCNNLKLSNLDNLFVFPCYVSALTKFHLLHYYLCSTILCFIFFI